MSAVDEVFGPSGLLARKFPAYEAREGQVQLARAVESAMGRGHLVGEGPCGSGKTLAYLVPAIYHSTATNDRVVVATANIALQEQLIKKDLPLLREVLPMDFRYTLLKGRGNYFCPVQAADTAKEGKADHLKDVEYEEFHRLLEWGDESTSGDKSDLAFEPKPRLWAMVSAGNDECLGKSCSQIDRCGYYAAKSRAYSSNIIVTNQHMLFAHVAVRMLTGDDLILPEHDIVVLDEAHEAADIARDFFGFMTSRWGILRLAHHMHRVSVIPKVFDKEGNELSQDLTKAGNTFFDEVISYAKSNRYKTYLKAQGWVDHKAIDYMLGAVQAHAGQAAREYTGEGERDRMLRLRWTRIQRLAAKHQHAVREAVELKDQGTVCWIEDNGGIKGSRMHVSGLLRTQLFDKTKTVVLTSATLAVGGDLGFVRQELGVPEDAQGLVVGTPFDFWNQTRFVVPSEAVEPSNGDSADVTVRLLRQVIALAGGRTLALFTSHRMLQYAAQNLGKLPYTVLVQGTSPRSVLAAQFREIPTSVLLGTESFWMGIDVPGVSLTAVFIDKLPFPNMSDPLMAAFKDRTDDSFMAQMIPRAVMMFRQGVGRLIRTRTDYGLIVVADQRITTKNYGQLFLESLPSIQAMDDLRAAGEQYRKWVV